MGWISNRQCPSRLIQPNIPRRKTKQNRHPSTGGDSLLRLPRILPYFQPITETSFVKPERGRMGDISCRAQWVPGCTKIIRQRRGCLGKSCRCTAGGFMPRHSFLEVAFAGDRQGIAESRAASGADYEKGLTSRKGGFMINRIGLYSRMPCLAWNCVARWSWGCGPGRFVMRRRGASHRRRGKSAILLRCRALP